MYIGLLFISFEEKFNSILFENEKNHNKIKLVVKKQRI